MSQVLFAIVVLSFMACMLLAGRLAYITGLRDRRIKRGLCPACAYPVGTNDVCTECGKPVKR